MNGTGIHAAAALDLPVCPIISGAPMSMTRSLIMEIRKKGGTEGKACANKAHPTSRQA
jgi:hypothetical protein